MADRVPILMYHLIDDERSPISVSEATFASQMRWLHDRRYSVLTLSSLAERLNNRKPLPQRCAVITFDDGFESTYTSAFPILLEYGFPATVFLVPDYCGRQNEWPSQPPSIPCRPLLNWLQVAEMDRHGIEMGAHTLSHPRLDRLPPDQIALEVFGSRTAIEDRIGHAVETFAYPYGRHNEAVRAIVSRAFLGACGTRLALADRGSDTLALERIEASYLSPPLALGTLAGGPVSPYLALRRTMRAARSALFHRPWT